MSLNALALQALKPQSKTYTRADRDGLFIEVTPAGKKIWRYKFHFEGKRPKLTIGPFPEIGLADARALRDQAAALLARGINPAEEKQTAKRRRRDELAMASNFEELAERWFAYRVSYDELSEGWQYNVRNWFKSDIFPALGKLDPRTISYQEVQSMIDKIVARGSPNSAEKVRVLTFKIFEFGAADLDDRNPAARVRDVKTPKAKSHRPLQVAEIKPFFDALAADDARPVNKMAIELLMLTLVRKDELRLAKWVEFDFDNLIWRIPGHRMKSGNPHNVYLARQVVELLEQLKPFSRPDGYVLTGFSSRAKPIGHTTLNNLIDRLDITGARFVPHGFRSTASTLLNEAKFHKDAIERQLAHTDPHKVRKIYNHAEYAEDRRVMLQRWADYISNLKQGKKANLSAI